MDRRRFRPIEFGKINGLLHKSIGRQRSVGEDIPTIFIHVRQKHVETVTLISGLTIPESFHRFRIRPVIYRKFVSEEVGSQSLVSIQRRKLQKNSKGQVPEIR